MQGSHHNLPAQVPIQWHKSNWRWICLLRGWHPATHCGRARLESVAPWQMLPILMASPLKTTPPKLEREVSMTMEVRSLPSRAMLDTSGHMSGNSTPKRPNPMVVLTPPTHKLREISGPVDTSSQVSTLDDTEMAEASLEEAPTTISPIAKTPGPSSSTPPADASHLWEKANKVLKELLATKKSSINAHRWKVVWELGMELHQNNSETTEFIKEARAICTIMLPWTAEASGL